MLSKRVRLSAAVHFACAAALAVPTIAAASNNVADHAQTTTPIKHVIVIFGENVSFDHYFATYPYATNPKGEPAFHKRDDTPRADNLLAAGLLDQNPNSTQPFRMDTGAASVTCDQNHSYTPQQKAVNHGLMDKFPEFVGSGASATDACNDYGKGPGVTMGYFDGNTVTAIWNYAQYFAMSDNSYGTTYGPSTPGALNLIAGTTAQGTLVPLTAKGTPANPAGAIADGIIGATTGAVIGDARPGGDECVLTSPNLQGATMVTVAGTNVGDLLNAKHVTWGWFQGGFAPTGHDSKGRAVCGAHHASLATDIGDYIPHHEPFQYFASTQNLKHVRPSDPRLIGTSQDGAHHQYDLSDFWTALGEDKLPSVSYLKAAAYQDGHPGYSDPVDEQHFIVSVVNAIANSPYWNDTAIILSYDDSDGWYDHVLGPVVNQSAVADDALVGTGSCGSSTTGTQGRCGYGPRLPLLVISPFARQNFIDHRISDQSSILRFIEDNWDLGRIGGSSADAKAGNLISLFDFDDHERAPRLILDPATGLVLSPRRY